MGGGGIGEERETYRISIESEYAGSKNAVGRVPSRLPLLYEDGKRGVTKKKEKKRK